MQVSPTILKPRADETTASTSSNTIVDNANKKTFDKSEEHKNGQTYRVITARRRNNKKKKKDAMSQTDFPPIIDNENKNLEERINSLTKEKDAMTQKLQCSLLEIDELKLKFKTEKEFLLRRISFQESEMESLIEKNLDLGIELKKIKTSNYFQNDGVSPTEDFLCMNFPESYCPEPSMSGIPSFSLTHYTRVHILSDSHGKGVVSILSGSIHNMKVTGFVKPGGLTSHVISDAYSILDNSREGDILVIISGSNDVYSDENMISAMEIYQQIIKNYSRANIIISTIPGNIPGYRQTSIRLRIKQFNKFIKGYGGLTSRVKILELHKLVKKGVFNGLHFNSRGKLLICELLQEKILAYDSTWDPVAKTNRCPEEGSALPAECLQLMPYSWPQENPQPLPFDKSQHGMFW